MGAGASSISFSTLVLSLASTALIHLGDSVNPEAGQVKVDLAMARQSIDLLEMLAAKTTGNLDGDEQKLLQSVLTDLRMRFLERSR
jgi:Domain of unknown function (DUF1844)